MVSGRSTLVVVKSMSDSSVFLIAVTAFAIVSLVIGYLTFNTFNTKRRRRVEWGLQAATNKMSSDHDTNPMRVKTRIIQTLTRNTSDINMLNNTMHHVLVKIDSDMQKDGLLHGLMIERSTGAISKPTYEAKLSEYVKNLAASLNIPLMSRVRGPYGSMYGRMRGQTGRGSALYGFSSRRAYPAPEIEMLDEELRRY